MVLINSMLSSLPMFMMSFFEMPRGVLQKIDCFRSRFYWQNDEHKRKYRLAKWEVTYQPKDQGGLGIQNLETQNKGHCPCTDLPHNEGIYPVLRRFYHEKGYNGWGMYGSFQHPLSMDL